MKSSTTTRALIGLLASAAFLWTLTLSVSPQLHERIHPDANRIDHSCAITFIASGSYNYSPAAPLLSVPALVDQFSSIFYDRRSAPDGCDARAAMSCPEKVVANFIRRRDNRLQ